MSPEVQRLAFGTPFSSAMRRQEEALFACTTPQHNSTAEPTPLKIPHLETRLFSAATKGSTPGSTNPLAMTWSACSAFPPCRMDKLPLLLRRHGARTCETRRRREGLSTLEVNLNPRVRHPQTRFRSIKALNIYPHKEMGVQLWMKTYRHSPLRLLEMVMTLRLLLRVFPVSNPRSRRRLATAGMTRFWSEPRAKRSTRSEQAGRKGVSKRFGCGPAQHVCTY